MNNTSTKKSVNALLLLLVCVVLFTLQFVLQNCIQPIDDPPGNTYYKPVFMSRAQLENSIKVEQPKAMLKSGKIVVRGTLLFINEPGKGVHIYNNANPDNPVNIAFVAIPGSHDIAVKNFTLYADNAVDLVAIDFDPNTTIIKNITRLRKKFPEPVAPDVGIIPDAYNNPSRRGDSILIHWIK